MQQTFKNMSVSFLGSSLCQIGAAAILAGTNLAILQRLFYVLVWSGVVTFFTVLLLFAAMMFIVGPQFKQGDLFYFCLDDKEDESSEHLYD